MSRPFLHAVLTGLVALVLTSEARAQGTLPRFDCTALLNDTGLADSTARIRQRLNAAPLTLTWIAGDDIAPPPQDAPVTLVPLRTGISPRLARSEPVRLGDQVMVCTLIGVTARPYIDAETPYMISDLRGAARPARIPLLLVGRYPDAAAADQAFAKWVERGFPLPLQFQPPLERAVTSPSRGTEYTLLTDHRSFAPMDLLGNTEWNEANILAINPDRASQDTRIFLRTAELDEARMILALCGSGDCADFRAADAAPPRLTTAPAPLPLADPILEPAPNPLIARPDYTPEAPSGLAVAADPAPMEHTSGPTPLRLTYVDPDGQEAPVPDALTNRLDCVLSALGADVFLNPPECRDPAFDALHARRALIRPVDPHHWQIVTGAQDRPPKAVLVTLPAGQSGALCTMELVYDGPDGAPVRIPLNPVPGATPAQFTAIPTIAMPVHQGMVHMALSVSAAQDCGGPGRDILVPTAAILSVRLVDSFLPNRAALYVIAMDAGDLETTLGLGPTERSRLGAQMVDAIETTQARVAAQWQGQPWTLSQAQIAYVDETDGLIPILTLTSDNLRDKAAAQFAELSGAIPSNLGQTRPQLSAETLAEALQPAVDQAAARGVTDLMINVLAPVTPRIEADLTAPCSDPRFLTLARDLTAMQGVNVTLQVFPITRLRNGDEPDLTPIQPLSFDPLAPSQPSGLTRCRTAPDSTEIYPFFAEPWRPGRTIGGRYSTALSDQMAVLLLKQLNQK